MDIKIIKESEIDLLIPIKEEFNKDYGISEKSKDFILKELKNYVVNGAIIVALEGSESRGYLSGLIEENEYEKTGYIGEIFVLKDYRGMGLSTKLKDKFIEFLKSKKIEICRIEVNPNNIAQEVYKKWGFKIDKYRMGLKI